MGAHGSRHLGRPSRGPPGGFSDARGDLQDQRLNASDDTFAAALNADPEGVASPCGSTSRCGNCLDQGRGPEARQASAAAPDPLSRVLWADAEAQQNSPNLGAVTASQVEGFNADQASLA
jgi:hypothetical protein